MGRAGTVTIPTGTTVKPLEMSMLPRESVPRLHITDKGARAPGSPKVRRLNARNSVPVFLFPPYLFLMVTE